MLYFIKIHSLFTLVIIIIILIFFSAACFQSWTKVIRFPSLCSYSLASEHHITSVITFDLIALCGYRPLCRLFSQMQVTELVTLWWSVYKCKNDPILMAWLYRSWISCWNASLLIMRSFWCQRFDESGHTIIQKILCLNNNLFIVVLILHSILTQTLEGGAGKDVIHEMTTLQSKKSENQDGC